MKYKHLISVSVIVAFMSVLSAVGSENKTDDELAGLGRETANLKQKALDIRTLGVNALKNADAARSKAGAVLIEALLNSNEPAVVDASYKDHDDASDSLQDAAEKVRGMICDVMKAELALNKAAELLNIEKQEGVAAGNDFPEVRKLLKSAASLLKRTDKASADVRKEWLEPFLSSAASPTVATTVQESVGLKNP